jgi:hypothetical protein
VLFAEGAGGGMRSFLPGGPFTFGSDLEECCAISSIAAFATKFTGSARAPPNGSVKIERHSGHFEVSRPSTHPAQNLVRETHKRQQAESFDLQEKNQSTNVCAHPGRFLGSEKLDKQTAHFSVLSPEIVSLLSAIVNTKLTQLKNCSIEFRINKFKKPLGR